MSTPDIRPNRENWKDFCQEDPLTVEETAAWREMADSLPNEDLLTFVIEATKDEEAAYRQVELCKTRDYPNLVKMHDANLRYQRAELRAWARWQAQRGKRIVIEETDGYFPVADTGNTIPDSDWCIGIQTFIGAETEQEEPTALTAISVSVAELDARSTRNRASDVGTTAPDPGGEDEG